MQRYHMGNISHMMCYRIFMIIVLYYLLINVTRGTYLTLT